MFGIGLPEIIVILVLALLVFGPRHLPELGRELGRWIHELRATTQRFTEDLQEVIKVEIPDEYQDRLAPPEGKDRSRPPGRSESRTLPDADR